MDKIDILHFFALRGTAICYNKQNPERGKWHEQNDLFDAG